MINSKDGIKYEVYNCRYFAELSAQTFWLVYNLWKIALKWKKVVLISIWWFPSSNLWLKSVNLIIFQILISQVVYSSSYDLSNPTHFDEIGDCNENFYLGNKKVFTLRAPFRQTEQTFVFPRVTFENASWK